MCLTADPGVASSIPAQSHNFMEIDHEIISSAILLPFKKGCCQVQAVVCARSTEASLTMRVLSSARCTGVRLFTLRIKIGTNQRALGELSHC